MSAADSFGRCIDSWISIQTVTENMLRMRYGLPGYMSPIQAVLSSGGVEIETAKFLSSNQAGQICFENLQPETDYVITFTAGEKSFVLNARTLPRMQGEKLFKLALFADFHISLLQETRHGRLHVESRELMKLAFMQAKLRQCDAALFPGDQTDEGLLPEYEAVMEALAEFPIPCYMTPGNHDIVNGGDEHYRRFFGCGAYLKDFHGFQLISLDTGNGRLAKAENKAVVDALDLDKKVILFTHHQLFADDWIPDANKIICDADDPMAAAMLEKLARCKGIAYIGHKNVAAKAVVNDLVQLNLPQLTHFPAGYLEATYYTDGVVLEFVPITSEVQNEYSRRGTEAARYHSHPDCDCKSKYRDGFTQAYWNGVIR